MQNNLEKHRKRLFEIIEVGTHYDKSSREYDLISTGAILLNLAVSILYTYEEFRIDYGEPLLTAERITVAFFCIDYILRLWTAKYLYRNCEPSKALRKYVFSFSGIVDLLSFLPYYLPIFFPSGIVAFRMLRIVRIFRLFRINSYYDSLNVIGEVLSSKKQQLLSSVSIILILMVSSSLCMYSIEHQAQPHIFTNAFSGIWWAASTLLTVGYGDIYPVTTLGKMFGIFIAFLGVGMVAIPTGIISAGFVDQYTRLKMMQEYGRQEDMHFIQIELQPGDAWVGKTVESLGLPIRTIPAVIQREGSPILPQPDTVLNVGDIFVLSAETYQNKDHISLTKRILRPNNPWAGKCIKDLDISRQSLIVLVRRGREIIIPDDNLQLRKYDVVFMYTETHFGD